MERIYIAIDLKSYYSSAEAATRNLDPLNTHIVVADESKSEKTICLAVSPSLKELGVKGRPRLFEVNQIIRKENYKRLNNIPGRKFKGKSFFKDELENNPYLEIDVLKAKPRMSYYLDLSTKIYSIYLKYVSKDDIHIYSIDEVFIDITNYISLYNKNPQEIATMIVNDIYNQTKITATVGIGSNLYLAKVAMDIVAKHMKPNRDGVRIAYLDEMKYRKLLWSYKPLTAFWRVGKGYENNLHNLGLYTMGDIAKYSIDHSHKLFEIFGKNAQLLIDHAWGYEPVLMKDIKAFKPKGKSVGSGQVLSKPYPYDKAYLVLKEMIELLLLEFVSKKLMTKHIIIIINYDINNINDHFKGETKVDFYGRTLPKEARLNIKLDDYTTSFF